MKLGTYSSSDGDQPILMLYKSSSNTIGTETSTANGESLGQICFTGIDGAPGLRYGAIIRATQSNTVGTDTVPTKLEFLTDSDSGRDVRLTIAEEGYTGLNVDWNTNNSLRIGSLYKDVTESETNYQNTVAINTYSCPIDATSEDSGYRIALAIHGFYNTDEFAGTLEAQYGIWCRVGSNTTDPTGHMNKQYGIYVENLVSGNVSVDDMWGVYQSQSVAKNYFAGNVGIGINDPGASLDLYGGSGTTLLALGGGSSTFNTTYYFDSLDPYGLGMATNGSKGVLYTSNEAGTYRQVYGFSDIYSSDGTIFGIGSSGDSGSSWHPNFVTTQTGKVGIGTSDPECLLHLFSSSVGSVESGTRFAIEYDGSHYINMLGNASSEVGIVFGDGSDANAGGVTYDHNNDRLQLRTGGANQVFITSGGDMGIGTDTPGNEFNVHKPNSGSIYMQVTNTTTGNGVSDGLRVGIDANEAAYVWNQSNTHMYFGNDARTAMMLDSDGRLTLYSTGNGRLRFDNDGTYSDIHNNTSDGADNQILRIGGGGDVIYTRGGFIEMHGNEATSTGDIIIQPGEDGHVRIIAKNDGADSGLKLVNSGGNEIFQARASSPSEHGMLELSTDGGSQNVVLRASGESTFTGGNISLTAPGANTYLYVDAETNYAASIEFQENSTKKWVIWNDPSNDQLKVSNGSSNDKIQMTQAGYFSLGAGSPSRKLHVADTDNVARFERTSTITDGSGNVVEFRNSIDGTAEVGVGTSVSWQCENGEGTSITTGSIHTILTDVSASSTASKFDFYTLKNGANANILSMGGEITLGNVTHTADNEHIVSFFGDQSSNAQSGNYNSKIMIYGGGTQSRNLTLYQDYGGYGYVNAAGWASHRLYLQANTVTGMWIDGNGYIYMPNIADDAGDYAMRYTTSNGYVTYTSSDSRVKTDQRPLEYGLDEVMKLQPKIYNYHGSSKFNDDGTIDLKEKSKVQVGLIAQEVYPVIPEVVYRPKDDTKNLWSVDYDNIVPVLINAIKELSDKINVLESKLEEVN